MHYCSFFTNPDLIKTILSLYPDHESKEKALLCQTNNGITPFHKAYTSNNSAVGKIIWKNIKNTQNKLKIINTNCINFKTNIDLNGINSYISNWHQMLKDLLKNMNEKYISDPTLLIPSFYVSVRANDITFAKFIVSKVNKKNQESVLKFVTTKIPSMNDENCLHFAAYSKMSEFMGFLFHLLKNINCDLTQILLNESIIKNKYDETPLSIACKKNHFFVLRYVLSKMKTQVDKLKLIEMVWKYEITKTSDNYRHKDDYQLGVNCVLTCCLFQNLGCLKEILSHYDDKSIQKVISFRNNKKQTIFRFLKNIETCKFLEKTFKSFHVGFKEFNQIDVDGMTPFMAIIKHSSKLKFIIWILNQCKTDSEKLKLIYNCNKNGDNSLDLAPSGSMQELFLIKTIKSILSTYQRIKDITFLIPIFLHSLKTGKIDLSQFLLSLLNNDNDKKIDKLFK